jgi:hypothetical protein
MGRIFKASLTDGPRRIMRDSELAQRKLIANFHGKAFVAEREGSELCVYLVSGDNVGTNTIGDRANGPMTANALQKVIEQRRTADADAEARAAVVNSARR